MKLDTSALTVSNDIVAEGDISLPDGSQSAPSLNFSSAASAGMYLDGSGPTISANGTKRLKVGTVTSVSYNPMGFPDGSLGSPSVFFSSDPTSGLWFAPGGPTVAVQTAGN
jgi:hypothetical protein